MNRQKFYAIGHNPNTLQMAENFLRAGANALAPDISYSDGKYFISHGGPGSNPFTEEHELIPYLSGLGTLLLENRFNLAMLFFDIKDPVFDINEFLGIVQEHFLKIPVCGGVAILVTTAKLKDVSFLNNYNQSIENAGIGVDEYENPQEVNNAFKESGQKSIVYGNGITTVLPKPGLYYSITEAKYLQAQGESFKLVFTWVLTKESSMRSYLDLHIDGIFTDLEDMPQLLHILNEAEFSAVYELAKIGYNPWLATQGETYSLTVKTRDVMYAGTDSRIRFILSGRDGQLATTVDASFDHIMERNSMNHVILEGQNIGQIKGLTIEVLDGGIGSCWLPEYIQLDSQSHERVMFHYDEDEWLCPEAPSVFKTSKNLDTLKDGFVLEHNHS